MGQHRLMNAPLGDLTFGDVEDLIGEEAEEGPRLELKRGLPSNDRNGDPWMQGANRIANPARDGLAKEVVAFANAYGGVVVVGIDETDDHPKRARGPEPVWIPRVAECAERLQQALDALIDPPLPVLEMRGIEKPDGNGEGVLVIRTGASTRAPHGHGKPPQAYMRRGSRSEPMTMRDLQSVLFETRTRAERIREVLSQRRENLVKMIEKGPGAFRAGNAVSEFRDDHVLYFRCTVVAVEQLHLHAEVLARDNALRRPHMDVHAFGSQPFSNHWALRLNGVENQDFSSRHFSRWFVGDHGIVDAYGYIAMEPYRHHTRAVYPGWFPPVAMQALAMGSGLRNRAGRPDVELVVECEFFNPASTAVAIYGDGRSFDSGTAMPEGWARIGPFSFGGIEDFQITYLEIQRGIWHCLGLPTPEARVLDLEEWLAEARQG